nr:hypothetical protein [Roseiconus lacunae]
MRKNNRIAVRTGNVVLTSKRLFPYCLLKCVSVSPSLLKWIFDLNDSMRLLPIPATAFVVIADLAAFYFEDQDARFRMNDYKIGFAFSERYLTTSIISIRPQPWIAVIDDALVRQLSDERHRHITLTDVRYLLGSDFRYQSCHGCPFIGLEPPVVETLPTLRLTA